MATYAMKDIDEIDKKILEFLQEDAKMTITRMSELIDLSPTAIRARLQKLEKKYIKKYAAILDCRQMGYQEMVMASIRLNSTQRIDEIKKELEGMDEIKYAYIVTGEYPLFIMAKCLDHPDAMGLIDKLRNLNGVEEIKTQMVLDRVKEDHSIIIPEVREEK